MATAPDSISLLRTEAEHRAGLLQVEHTQVDLDLTAAGDTFTSRSTVRFTSSADDVTFLDFKGDELVRATLDGQALDLATWSHGRIPLTLTAGSHTVVVDGVMAYSSDGEGLHRHVDPADGSTYLYAMSFLAAAPRWYACFDQPDLKSAYELIVSAPPEWTVLGNGPSEQQSPGHWRIVPLHPLSTYYVTLVAGPYASVFDEHDGIPLGVHCRASLKDALEAEAPDLFAVTKASLDYYHRVFDVRYPYGEYHQAFVPDFNAGAMENPGCVTFRDAYIFRARATASERATRAGTVAHEMAHMWFGDLVTMRWWDDLWLNESFAEYMAHRCCTEATEYPIWTEFGIVRKDWGAVADQGPSTHPVAGNGSADAEAALQDFDGISYAKGAAVLKQLVAYVGDDVFFAGLKDYFEAHAFGNAEFADLIGAWKGAGAEGLDAWAQSWLRTSGMDRVEVATADGSAAATLTRVPPEGSPADRTHALTVATYAADGSRSTTATVTLAGEPLTLTVPDGTALVLPDAGDETWASVRAGDWASVRSTLPLITEEPARVVLWNSVRDAVRNADLDPAVALDVVGAGIVGEQADVIVDAVLGFALTQLAGPYAAPHQRAARSRIVADLAWDLTQAAPSGSDRQLAAFRIAIDASADVEQLGRWHRAEELPEGLCLDPELTWGLVARLATLTGEESVITETLVADPSASAHVHAARARASLPTARAKEAAWELITAPSDLSAYELYATAQGFFAPTQEELTEPYVSAYFAQVTATAEFRTGWALGRVAALAYPSPFSTSATLAQADLLLARTDVAQPVRRSVVDATDRLRRATSSRERFGR